MSATPRSARLSKPGEVVAILAASAIVWVVLIATLFTLFFAVFLPTVELGGRSEIPGDFPVYPGAQLSSAVATHWAGCTTVSATWTTTDGAIPVMFFYQDGLSSGPWTITSTRPLSDPTLLYFRSKSGANREGYVSVGRGALASRTQISMTMAKTASDSRTATSCHALAGEAG